MKNRCSSWLTINIVPPAGYLGATVTFGPEASIEEGASGSNTVFINGFNASVGPVTLPALTAQIEGELNNKTSFEAISSVELSLDVISVSGVDTQPNSQGVRVLYNHTNFTAITDATGNFKFTGLPVDSIFTISAVNIEFNDTLILETAAPNEDQLGYDLLATLIEDLIAPYIIDFAQVGNLANSIGFLTSGFSTVKRLNFQKQLTAHYLIRLIRWYCVI